MNKQEIIKICNQFIEHLEKKNLSIHTIKAYERDLNQLMHFWDILESNENQIFNFKNIIPIFINSLYQEQLTVSSIARKISCINSLKKFMVSNNKTDNKEIFIKRPLIQQQKPINLNNQKINQFMDQICLEDIPSKYPLRDKTIIELLYATAMRCSEIVNIELQHINIKNKSILIQTKNKRERYVFFGSKALDSLQNYLSYERVEAKDLREKLFLNHRNQPLTVRSVQRICIMFYQFLGTKEKITPNILRNSCATHLLDNGASIENVQKLLGHKSIVSTQRYQHKKNHGDFSKKIK